MLKEAYTEINMIYMIYDIDKYDIFISGGVSLIRLFKKKARIRH